MPFIHKNLAQGRWQALSFAEQIGNIGAELARVKSWSVKGRDEYKVKSLERVLELIDLTLTNTKQPSRLKETARLREVVAGLFVSSEDTLKVLQSLERFYLPFARLARKKT